MWGHIEKAGKRALARNQMGHTLDLGLPASTTVRTRGSFVKLPGTLFPQPEQTKADDNYSSSTDKKHKSRVT